MFTNRFNIVVKEFTDHEMALLGTKREDYTRGDQDCLVNFKEASAILGMTPELYCSTLLIKHVHSILKVVKQGGINPQDWCWASPRGEGVKQHISDARNFFILLAALIQDGMDQTVIIEDDGEP